jgi:transcriptional/translational regulatory protein YebC/TACO1
VAQTFDTNCPLQALSLRILHEESGLVYVPHAPVEVNDEDFEANELLYSSLLELDDVDAVYTNCGGLS